MKFTILGYKQDIANDLGLSIEDLLILRWIDDFTKSQKMESKVIDGETYYWVKYDYLLKELPILGFTKQTLARKLKKLTKKD